MNPVNVKFVCSNCGKEYTFADIDNGWKGYCDCGTAIIEGGIRDE